MPQPAEPPAAAPSWRAPGRARLERYWVLAVLTWSLVRISAVDVWLTGYGVDPWIYAVVDLGSSLPYAIASARTLGALVDQRFRRATAWGALAAVSFVAPDTYIVTAGRALPWGTYVVVGTVAATAATLAVRSGRAQVAARRAALADRLAVEPG